MKSIILKLAVVVGIVGITGCRGELVEVPPAHKGRVLTASGYEKEIKSPSRFRLPYSFTTPPKLVLVEASDRSKEESLEIYIPQDKMNLSVDIRGIYSIADDEERINAIFARQNPRQHGESQTLKINFDQVYETYAVQPIRTKTREILAEHSIQDIMANREALSQELRAKISEILEPTPIEVSQFALADIQPPSVILKAQEAAKKREIEIEEAEADKLVKLKEAEAAREVALKQQEVDLIEAETQVKVEEKLAQAVSEAYVVQRALKTLEAIAHSDNKVILVPTDALKNPAQLVGLNNEMLKEMKKEKKEKKDDN